jgi:hypothetical protein
VPCPLSTSSSGSNPVSWVDRLTGAPARAPGRQVPQRPPRLDLRPPAQGGRVRQAVGTLQGHLPRTPAPGLGAAVGEHPSSATCRTGEPPPLPRQPTILLLAPRPWSRQCLLYSRQSCAPLPCRSKFRDGDNGPLGLSSERWWRGLHAGRRSDLRRSHCPAAGPAGWSTFSPSMLRPWHPR